MVGALRVGLGVLLLGLPARARDIRIEAFGDSLTAGFLSHNSLASPPPLKQVSRMVSDMAMYLITGKDRYLAPHHVPDNAWPSRLAARFRAQGASVSVVNRAVSGAHSAHLPGQVSGVPEGEDTVALFFIGANDLCESGEAPEVMAERFGLAYDEAVAQWNRTHHNSRAYFLPVARTDKVFEALQGQVWFEGPNGRYRCEDSWRKLFPYCPGYYPRFRAGKLEEFIEPRVEAMNAALEERVRRWSREGGTNTFHYLPGVHDVSFEPAYFAVDCYHLSPYGQDALAQAVFESAGF